MTETLPPLECVADTSRAATLMHPLRLEILGKARAGRSASEIAAELDLPRQKVNYHVKALAAAGFLTKAGRRKKRNLYEQRYVATATSYLLAPDVLGPVGADRGAVEDRLSVAYLLALSAELQRDVARATRAAGAQGKRIATLSLDADIRFESAEQRTAFTNALRDAVTEVVAKHTSPAKRDDGEPGDGRPYRLVLGCYPVPESEPEE